MGLDYGPAAIGILFLAGQAKGLGKDPFIGNNLIEGGDRQRIAMIRDFPLACHPARSPHITDLRQRLPRAQPLRKLQQRALGHAVDQQVSLGVEQQRAAHLVFPEIIVGETAQRGLDAADYHRYIPIGLFQAGGIDDGGTVGTGAVAIAGSVGVIVAQLAGRSVVGHHGIHRPGRDREKQTRLAKHHEGFPGTPIRLGDDADPETVLLQPASQKRHTKGGVVDVGVAADKDDIQLCPAALVCFFFCRRDKRRAA